MFDDTFFDWLGRGCAAALLVIVVASVAIGIVIGHILK